MSHQEQRGTRGSREAARAVHLLTPEWEPVRSLVPCHLTAAARALDGALGRESGDCNESKANQKDRKSILL